MSKERIRPDWEAIEREYRAGQLSVAEIGRQNGISHPAILKRAKKEGWARNLAEHVREVVAARLVTEGVTTPNAREEEIIDAAAARGVEVVRCHRRDISSLNALAIRLRQKAEGLIDTVADLKDLDNATSVIESLARTASRLIPLERQAFNLDSGDDDRSKERPVDLSELSREQRAKFRAVLTEIVPRSGSGA